MTLLLIKRENCMKLQSVAEIVTETGKWQAGDEDRRGEAGMLTALPPSPSPSPSHPSPAHQLKFNSCSSCNEIEYNNKQNLNEVTN